MKNLEIWNFVAKIANPYFPLPDNFQQPSESLLRYSINYAVKNKVFPLFYKGCLRHGFQLPKEADALISKFERRRKAQFEAIKLLLDIREKHDIELMFFKTFKPFDYIPDDVDVLLQKEETLNSLINILERKGYFVIKVGTPEVVLRKIEKNTYVDLDIHKRLAVGYLDLFKVENLWRKHAYELIDLGDGYKVPKLSEDYEVVREAAYSLLKDFNLSIAGFYLGINAIMNRKLAVIEKIAIEENFLMHLRFYLSVVYSLVRELFGSNAKLQLRYERKDAPIVLTNLCRNLRLPYPYPTPVITWAYASRVMSEISRNRNIGILLQLLKQPSSKGIGIFINYIREHFH